MINSIDYSKSKKLILAPFAREATYLKSSSGRYQEILQVMTEMMDTVSREFLPPSSRKLTLETIEFMPGILETVTVLDFKAEAEFSSRQEAKGYIEGIKKAFVRYFNDYDGGEVGVDDIGARWISGTYQAKYIKFSVFYFYSN